MSYRPKMVWRTASAGTTLSVMAADSTPQLVTFTDDEGGYGITYTGGSTFTVSEAGTYFVSFSVVLSLASGTNKDFGIWLRKNGTDVPRSNSHCTVASANDDKTIAVTLLLALAAGDALTVYMRGTSTDLQL